MKLDKKVAVISGAGSGIGQATALLFAKEGAKVVVVDIDAKAGQQTVDMIKSDGLEVRAADLGKHFRSKLEAVGAPAVKETRGRGLLTGVEIKPGYPKARWFCEKFMAEGILCKDAHEEVIRFAPPLVIEQADVDWAMERIGPVLLSAERVR